MDQTSFSESAAIFRQADRTERRQIQFVTMRHTASSRMRKTTCVYMFRRYHLMIENTLTSRL